LDELLIQLQLNFLYSQDIVVGPDEEPKCGLFGGHSLLVRIRDPNNKSVISSDGGGPPHYAQGQEAFLFGRIVKRRALEPRPQTRGSRCKRVLDYSSDCPSPFFPVFQTSEGRHLRVNPCPKRLEGHGANHPHSARRHTISRAADHSD